jgi:hypothetical protein
VYALPADERGRVVAERKPFLLRLNPDVLEAVRRWADDDLRSLNAQIEFLLRRSLEETGRSRRVRRSPHAGPNSQPARDPSRSGGDI